MQAHPGAKTGMEQVRSPGWRPAPTVLFPEPQATTAAPLTGLAPAWPYSTHAASRGRALLFPHCTEDNTEAQLPV